MKTLLLSVTICLLALPQLTRADDLEPPWWRGRLSTTSQVWEFSSPDSPLTPILPDGPAAGGQPPLPSTQVTVTPLGGSDWLQTDQGRTGVWPLSGIMEVIVDNHDPKPENEKWVRVQLTWRPQDAGKEPIFVAINPPPTVPLHIIAEQDLGQGWIHTTYEFELDRNPPAESFNIEGSINVDELVIDTWCVVPEPATMVLLGIGTLAMGLMRRRRK